MKSINVGCALCEAPANMYCESDRASLCWRCDNKVHGANFLVAKHTRTALCHHCQAETPWTASGPRLPPSMSLCLSCADSLKNNMNQNQNRNQNQNTRQISVQSRVNDDDDSDNDDVESSLYEDDDVEEEYSSDDVDDTDNQVVPLTLSNGVTPLSIEMSGCSSAETGEEDVNSDLLTALPPVLLKRKREVFVSD